jgi:hypothetical protein
MGVPVADVDEQRSQAARMEADPDHVDRRLEQLRGDLDARGQGEHGGVGGDHVPDAIDRDRRIGLVAREDLVQRVSHRGEIGVVQGPLRIGRGVARREQQPIPLPKWDPELIHDPQQRLAARQGAARLDKAQMAGRDPGVEGEPELGQVPALTPPPQDRSDLRLGWSLRHRGRP